MKRRHLIATAGVLATGAAVPEALSEVIRLGFRGATAPRDYDALIAQYQAGLVSNPDSIYGASLLADVHSVQKVLLSGAASTEQFRAGAHLTQLFGLYRGNHGDLRTAFGWYATAIDLSDTSGDTDTRVWTRGRAASRGVYEGMRASRALELADEALALTDNPSTGAVEAYSAQVHVHALTSNLNAGRTAVDAMRRTADHLPVSSGGPQQRAVLFRNYLEGRIGSLDGATRAHEQAMAELADLPVWRVDASIYYGLAQARHGETDAGIDYALNAYHTITHPDRVLQLGLADLLRVVPARHDSPSAARLRELAYTGTAPWDTIR